MQNEKMDIHDLHGWCAKAIDRKLLISEGIDKKIAATSMDLIFPKSICTDNDIIFSLVKLRSQNALLIVNEDSLGFSGHSFKTAYLKLWFCQTDHQNAVRLRELFPFTAPSPLTGEQCTFGMGDRLGCATPGHLHAISKHNVAPVLAQQSVRELNLTKRTYQDAIDSATWSVFQEGYRQPWGADGDHLKTEEWVKTALEMGCTMITADVSDYIHNEYEEADPEQLQNEYHNLDAVYRSRIENEYLEKSYRLYTNETISFIPEELSRIALVYKEAIEYTETLNRAGIETGKSFDFEVSIDETTIPTLPQAHIFVVEELKKTGVEFVSLAPRFVGEFQKGIDYIGDVKEFERSIRTHAAIARLLSGYKLSIHSGSDKFSVFPSIGRETRGQFHIKTSGTSWLEALRVVAIKAPALFRTIHNESVQAFPITSKNYHVTPDFERLTNLEICSDEDLQKSLDNPHDRRVLHIAYGELLKNRALRDQIYEVLEQHDFEYWQVLERHFKKHLGKLGIYE